MFEGIGTLQSYLQMKNLKFAANYRLTTGQDFNAQKKKSQTLVEAMLQSSQSDKTLDTDALRTASIKQELLNGKELSDEEMRFLKEKAPELYTKAKKAQEAREELRAELRRCRTKSEAQQAVMHAMAKASAEASAELAGAKAMTAGGGAGAASMSSSVGADIGAAAGASVTGNAAVGTAGMAAAAGAAVQAPAAAVTTAAGVSTAGVSADAANAAMANTVSGGSGQSRFTMDPILEKFIMVTRAIADTWQRYEESKEYAEMPLNDTSSDTAGDLVALQAKQRQRAAAYAASRSHGQLK